MSEALAGSQVETMKAYYLQSGPMNDPGEFAGRLAELPGTVPEVVKALQGLLVHVFWAERYGLALSDARKEEVQLRSSRRNLARLLELDGRPLGEARPLDCKLVGNCRDFSLLCSTILRAKGVPARARCGFGTYFWPGHYEDHWVVEYWKESENRWAVLDAQLDDLQKNAMKIGFDTLDMPPGAFVTGGEAWQLCRQGRANPDDFGIFDMHGWDFVKGNLFRDILAINKLEILPWDFYEGMGPEVASASEEDLAFYDRIAELALPCSMRFAEARELYEQDERLHTPAEWAE